MFTQSTDLLTKNVDVFTQSSDRYDNCLLNAVDNCFLLKLKASLGGSYARFEAR